MTTLITVLVILICCLIVFGNIGVYIYKRVKHKPTGDCAYCAKGKDQLLKEYRKYTSHK